MFILVVILFSLLLGEKFLMPANILNITRQTAMISIMAVAMTFVIGSGQIDLSIGAITALSALVTALVIQSSDSILLAVAAGLLLGAVVGAVNGVLVTYAAIPAFLTTLGTMGIVRGLSMWITDTAAVPIQNGTFNFLFGTGDILGIPILLFWTLLFFIIGYFLLNRLPYGRHVLATGGNEAAASFSGINTTRIKILVMTVSGLFASMAGILYAGRMQAGRYTFGEGDELSVIAAVIIGGTSMAGGSGSILGAVMGSLLMGVINNGLILAGLSVAQQNIVRGAIIIIATGIGNKTAKIRS
jgi:ribose transport system permease protein